MIIKTRKKTYRLNILKCIENIFIVLGVLLLIWFCISYLEICIKNLDNPPLYSKLNLWVMLTNLGGGM